LIEILYGVFKTLNISLNKRPIQKKIIPKDSIANFNGLVEFDNLQSGLSGIAKILSGSLDYYFKGYTLIELDKREIMVPLFQHFLINPLNRKVTILKN
jgi:hypothetical protein